MTASSPNGNHRKANAEARIEQQNPQSETEYLRLLGETVRAARAQRGMTRKMLAKHSGVSERFLAQLEGGTGNASILVLRQIAGALDRPLEAILPERGPIHAELVRTMAWLRGLDPRRLAQAQQVLLGAFDDHAAPSRHQRIALIGLRGAGKSTVGKLLAQRLGIAFFELDRLIEQASGVPLGMIFDMYGQSGFRRFERRCLEELLEKQDRFVLATGGSLVSEPATYDRLLGACYTMWLRASPKEHMARVIAQGDLRPMARNPQAMSDLERILTEREQLYARADLTVDTSQKSIPEVVERCLQF